MPRHDPSEKTKQDILKTATRLSHEKGWDNVNIEEIVKDVGVTRGAFYHYFKSREELIYSVIIQSANDNPFEVVSKKKELNALEKLRLALKISLKPQLDAASKSGMQQTIYDPIVFKSNIFFSINVMSPCIERLFIEGNKDGSMSVDYPKHMSHVVALVFDEWVNPAIYQMSEQEFSERLLFLEQFGERLGVPIVDGELKQMLLQNYRYCVDK
jgi:AcrR family transcriptional regulator